MDKIKIYKNSFTVVLGLNNSGKTALAKYIKSHYDKSIIVARPKSINYKYNDLTDDLKLLVDKLRVRELYSYNFNTLSNGSKQVLYLIDVLNSDYDTIIIHNGISMVSPFKKEIILKYLKKQHKTIIELTSNKEDLIYSKHLTLIKDSEIIYQGLTIKVLESEKKFKQAGFELPFMAQLSLKLKYYNLIDKPVLNMNTMVDDIWKSN